MSKRLCSIVAVLVLSTACATGPAQSSPKGSKPDWVQGQSQKFPRALYLVGLGMGDNRRAAEERARAEISKVFEAKMTVTTGVEESETQAGRGGQSESAFSKAVFEKVKTASNVALEGVEIMENWQDGQTRTHYALAVLERSKALVAIQSKIADLDGQAEEWRSQMDAAGTKLTRIRYAMKLLAVLRAREALNAQHRVLDSSGKSIPSPFQTGAVKAAAARTVGELDVFVEFDCSKKGEYGSVSQTDCGEEIVTGILKGLNAFGFEAKTSGDPSGMDIIVKGTVTTAPIQGHRSDWKWARSTVTVSLKDGHTGKTIQRFDTSDRQASIDYDEAARRSRVKLSNSVASKVHEVTVNYFENQ